MKRSQIHPLPAYFDRYIHKCDDVEITDAIQSGIDELDKLPLEKWKMLGDTTYAPGKWTLKDILQHLIDAERIFTYRALAFARNEIQTMPNFPEDAYASTAGANNRSFEDLLDELKTVHYSFKALFASFSPAMLLNGGEGFKGTYTVGAIGFIMPGHQRWHLQIIEDKYLPLINTKDHEPLLTINRQMIL